MSEERMTKADLINEIKELRARIAEFKRTGGALQESEEKWQSLAENAPNMIMIVGREGLIKFINRTPPGFSAEKSIGKNIYDYINPQYRSIARQAIEQVFQTGEPVSYENIAPGPCDCDSWYETKVGAIKIGEQVVAATLFVNDITERKKAEEALREEKDRTQKYLEIAGVMLLVVNANEIVELINRRGCEILGCSEDEIVGKNWFDNFIAEPIREEVKGVFRKLMAGKVEPVEYYENSVITKSGEERLIAWHNTILKDEHGNIIGSLSSAEDITERKQAEQDQQVKTAILQNIISDIPYYVFWKDKSSIYLGCNDYFAKLAGLEKIEDIVGKTDYDLPWKKEESDFYRKIDKEVMSKGAPILNIEEPVHHGQGNVATILTSKVPLRNTDGEITGILGIFKDITERKKAEEKIRQLSSAVEQSIDGIAIGDLGPRLLYVNEAFARMHGYTPEEMIGMKVADLHNQEQMDEYKQGMNKIKTEGFYEGEIEHIKKDRTAFPTYMSVTLLKDNQGNPAGILAVARDITEIKRREQELNIYRENILRAERLASVGVLSAAMAHELSQPLTTIRLSIQNSLAELEKASCSEAVLPLLEDALSGVARADSIISGFRKVARRLPQKSASKTNVAEVARGVVQLFEDSARRAKVDLCLTGMDNLPPVSLNRRELEQLFYVLVENAIEAADKKKKRQLCIIGTRSDEHVELQFSDNCGGIKPELVDRIFEPFFTTKAAHVATGLGLSVAREIASCIGGKLWVESEYGVGSTFFVSLPINGGRD